MIRETGGQATGGDIYVTLKRTGNTVSTLLVWSGG